MDEQSIKPFDPAGRLLCRSASDGLVDQFEYDKEGEVVKAWNAHAFVEPHGTFLALELSGDQNGRQVLVSRYDLEEPHRAPSAIPVTGSAIISDFDVRGRIKAH